LSAIDQMSSSIHVDTTDDPSGYYAQRPGAQGHPARTEIRPAGQAIEPLASYPKGMSMEDRSQLAERIVDQVADAIIYANRFGVIIHWNRASAALFGFSAEDALGQSLDLIIPEHLRASHWSGFEAAITKGTMRLQGRPTLTRALHKSGRKLYVEMTFAIVKGEAEGEVLGSVAMARDVTDRVERERAVTRAA
jgi:PAS domain S-box-containing protein